MEKFDEKYWTYIRKCLKCGNEIRYMGLKREEYSWEKFAKIIPMKMVEEFDWCDKCKMMTLQKLVAYDYEQK